MKKAPLLKEARKDLLNEWDSERNTSVSLDDIKINSNKKVFWICSKNPKHKWEASVRVRAVEKEQRNIREDILSGNPEERMQRRILEKPPEKMKEIKEKLNEEIKIEI